MKKFTLILVLTLVALTSVLLISAFAQTATRSWAYVAGVNPEPTKPGLYEFTVPLQVMDKAREDLADLRLFDGNGREISYGLRIRLDVTDTFEIGGELFNRARVGSASEASVDLGEDHGEHNEVEIETSGSNFRRRVTIEGSDDSTNWRVLQSGVVIFRFESQNEGVKSDRLSYPTSRYRYLRVRVFADEVMDKEPPDITRVIARRAVRAIGELNTWDVYVPSYELLRNQGAPASAWSIDLGGRVPCDRLLLKVEEPSFSRPFQLEAGDDPQNLRLVAAGQLTRRTGEPSKPIVIAFEREEHVRKLRLLVTDYSNQTLTITAIKAAAPARQIVFELKEPAAQPLRLFFGNPHASAPHYDFERELAVKLTNTPVRIAVGSVANNPEYKPEPLPLTERVPWLIYLVLGISSLALALILFGLARSVTKRGEENLASDSHG